MFAFTACKAIPADAIFLRFKEVSRILTACWNFFIYHGAHKDAHALAFVIRWFKRSLHHLFSRYFDEFACFLVHPFAMMGLHSDGLQFKMTILFILRIEQGSMLNKILRMTTKWLLLSNQKGFLFALRKHSFSFI